MPVSVGKINVDTPGSPECLVSASFRSFPIFFAIMLCELHSAMKKNFLVNVIPVFIQGGLFSYSPRPCCSWDRPLLRHEYDA